MDVKAIVKELQKLIGMRLANVYNLDKKTFTFKLAGKDDKGENEKNLLLIESGVRLHTTKYGREKDKMPSPFCMKLRKHIRTKRLESIQQLGVDRIVDMKFGVGDTAFHIILEMYSSGNVILTDHKYQILILLRSHTFGKNETEDAEEASKVAVKEVYDIEAFTQNHEDLIESKDILDALQLEKQRHDEMEIREKKETEKEEVTQKLTSKSKGKKADKQSKANKGKEKKMIKAAKKKKELPLVRHILATNLQLGPDLLEHAFIKAGIDPKVVITDYDNLCPKIDTLANCVNEAIQMMQNLGVGPGYVVVRHQSVGAKKSAAPAAEAKEAENENEEKKQEVVEVFNEYLPVLLAQHDPTLPGHYHSNNCQFRQFPSFDTAVDEFYSNLEAQKDAVRLLKEKQAAWNKVERVKEHHKSAVQSLLDAEVSNRTRAELVELNAAAVDQAIASVNVQLATGQDWHQLERLIEEEKEKQNPVALIIHSLKLDSNEIVLLLSPDMMHLHLSKQELAEQPEFRAQRITVDLGLSAYNNAALFYSAKKKSAVKASRTEQSSEKAIKAATKKTEQALKDVDLKNRIQKLRKVHWFEKFHWFVTSENFLVVAGRDAQQNEAIVKKHLGKNDIYVHADTHGAASVVVKNPGTGEVPPTSLQQAGVMCVCRSSAWKNKVIAASFWVHAHQVSKTAPTGEYLTTGSFMIRGKKNYLPHSPLVMCIGFLFRLEDDHIGRHKGERKIRYAGGTADGKDANSDSDSDNHTPANTATTAATTSSGPAPPASKQAWAAQNGSASVVQGKTKSPAPAPAPAAAAAAMSVQNMGISPSQFERQVSIAESVASSVATDLALSQFSDEDEEDQEENELKRKQLPDRKRLSKKQREILKKVGPEKFEEAWAAAEQRRKEALDKAEQNKEQLAAKLQQKEEQAAAQKLKQKQKQNKKKKKGRNRYDSDEDEPRQDAQQQQQQQQPPSAGAEPTQIVTATPATATAEEVGADRACFHCGKTGHLFKDCPTRSEGGAAGATVGASSSFAQAKKAAKKGEEQELKELLEEEGVHVADDVGELDALTGKPNEDDLLRYAVPVCAPMAAMRDYKYAIKIIPGQTKKGKAARSVVETFLRNPATNALHKDLLRVVNEAELINVVPTGVKLSGALSGASKGPKGPQKRRKK